MLDCNTDLIELRWEGPFGWPCPTLQSDQLPLGNAVAALKGGIYLWTVEYSGGYLIYLAGMTRRPFLKRFQAHAKEYRRGVYTVFDVASLKRGNRTEIWHGFYYKNRPVEKQLEYDRRVDEITAAVNALLLNYRVFVAHVEPTPRILERIEGAIMTMLYNSTGPISAVPDRGMQLAPRWKREQSIFVRNVWPVMIHGLPMEFEV